MLMALILNESIKAEILCILFQWKAIDDSLVARSAYLFRKYLWYHDSCDMWGQDYVL